MRYFHFKMYSHQRQEYKNFIVKATNKDEAHHVIRHNVDISEWMFRQCNEITGANFQEL